MTTWTSLMKTASLQLIWLLVDNISVFYGERVYKLIKLLKMEVVRL